MIFDFPLGECVTEADQDIFNQGKIEAGADLLG